MTVDLSGPLFDTLGSELVKQLISEFMKIMSQVLKGT